MLYIIDCKDKPDHLQVRLDNRPLHLEYLQAFMDQVVMVGPTLTDDGDGMTGSLLIMEFEDRRSAEDFCQNDPYAKAGLFESTSIRRWKKVLPAD